MTRTPSSSRAGLAKALLSHETFLGLLVLAEIFYFNSVGRNFATADNISNVIRHSTEIGLLALAMMPIILTGGIDLSVGSLLGLCAVIFGKLSQQTALSPWSAGAMVLIIGAAAGGMNALLITRLRLPPLIVTLGTYSLFRGVAEAITKGTATYSKFAPWFLDLGNRVWFGLPVQGWILLLAAICVWILIHQTTYGRTLRAVGFSYEGARYAGLPVARKIACAYVMAGLIAALAAILFTARVTQARADAGVGYELLAITAVVLGGTSIFGGVGTVHGTLLGVAALAILNNGLSRVLSITNISRELSGLLTGALLIVALAAGLFRTKRWRFRRKPTTVPSFVGPPSIGRKN